MAERVFVVLKTGYRQEPVVKEYDDTPDALKDLETTPRSHIVGIFCGRRLEPIVGEKKVTKKAITGFQESSEEEL